MMIDLSAFFPRIQPFVPGAAYPVIEDAIRLAAEQFCERTRLWRTDDTVTLTESSDTSYLCAQQHAVIHEVESARGEAGDLQPISISALDEQFDDWRGMTGSAPQYYTQIKPDTLRFVPVADSGQVTVQLILKPSPAAKQLPDFIFSQYSRVIAAGAKAELMVMPGAEYTKSGNAAAAYYLTVFNSELDRISRRFLRGQQRAPVRTVGSFY
jgi:hypothetical protein